MESQNSDKIFPVISIAPLISRYANGDGCVEKLHDDPEIKSVLSKLTNAFKEWGFVYLIDHGIDSELISNAFKTSRNYFEQEKSFKEKFKRTTNEDNWGYVPFNIETFDKNRPFDLKECFNFTPRKLSEEQSVNGGAEFMEASSKLSYNCHTLTKMLLHLFSPAIKNDELDFLLSKHRYIGNQSSNTTTLRLLYYPVIENEEDILENQLRCGEHSDYGTITLLFQDEAGGLQVVSPNGEYVDAVPVPGSIVVNVGDMTEIWTSGKYKSTRHRVVICGKNKLARQSMVYFVHPDNEVDAHCLDGSDKYETVNAFQYLMKKFSESY